MTAQHPVNCLCCPNPVIRETPLRAYSGWIVRTYQDGMMDATNNVGLTRGCRTFTDTLDAIRECLGLAAIDRSDDRRADWSVA